MVLGLGKSREEKDFEKGMDMQEPYQESSDDSMARDAQMSEQRPANFPSNMIPEDFYMYKRFINLPESQAQFVGKIDKDAVFANLSGAKPSLQELQFQIGTIELCEGEWFTTKNVYLRDEDGRMVCEDVEIDGVKKSVPLIREIRVFDEEFRSCMNFLMADYKFAVVASRALGGSERAANLDVSTNTRISKEFSKKKESTSKSWGTGMGG